MTDVERYLPHDRQHVIQQLYIYIYIYILFFANGCHYIDISGIECYVVKFSLLAETKGSFVVIWLQISITNVMQKQCVKFVHKETYFCEHCTGSVFSSNVGYMDIMIYLGEVQNFCKQLYIKREKYIVKSICVIVASCDHVTYMPGAFITNSVGF